MKRTERHHLKENVVALSVARAKESLDRNQRRIVTGAIAVLVVIAAVWGYFGWRSRTEARSRAALAEAIEVLRAPVVPPVPPPTPAPEGTPPAADAATPPATPPPPPGSFATERAKLEAALPKLQTVADAYASSQAGIAARYYAAAALVGLDRSKEAAELYRQVIDRDQGGLYRDMARLGLADAHAAAKDYEPAIEGYRELTTRSGGTLPVDGILMQLGRTYVLAGKRDEATRTFRRIVEEFPDSIYSSLAQRELDAVKSGA